MIRCLIVYLLVVVPWVGAQESKPRLLIAFASYRERPKHPNIFFYEHDGVATGKITGSITTPRSVATAEAHPWLTHDGLFCAFTFEEENKTSRIHFWDMAEKKLIDLPEINATPNAQLSPSLSGDGNLIAFSALNRPKGPGAGYHVFLYDRPGRKLIDLPGLNSPTAESRLAKISADGRFIGFTSTRKGGAGLTDIYLYDRTLSKLLDVPGLNSESTDVEPSLSGDGALIAFASDRVGGKGSRDIYLYDRTAGKLLPLPGLNSPGPEYHPVISADGRFVVFSSERITGEGERDIYLYDRTESKLLPTPGLNSKAEDFDPSIIVTK